LAIIDLFSRREARKRKIQDDVLRYDELPQALRVQILHILDGALGVWRESRHYSHDTHLPNQWWREIHQALARERGDYTLTPGSSRRTPWEDCRVFLVSAPVEEALDLVEMCFRLIDRDLRLFEHYQRVRQGLTQVPDDAIDELNARFRLHAVGYEFAGGDIIRIDSKLLHAEAVRPALHLLQGADAAFEGPLDEFLSAHGRYRKGEFKEAVADALKSFESVMKSICTERGWPLDPQKDTAKQLIDIVLVNGLVPAYLQSQFSALRTVMESGVPTARNKTSGHGQGPTPVELPRHFASYVLNMAASNIVFLIESHKAMK